VILRSEAGDGGPDVVAELRSHVAKEIGAIAKPRQIMVVEELPKTRSSTGPPPVLAREPASCSGRYRSERHKIEREPEAGGR
jgi:hypothetical protein